MVADHRRSLAARRVLITGGTSGIGLATAQQLTDAGARVILLARGEAGLDDAASRLGGAATVSADVGNAAELNAAAAEAAGVFEGLDAVIANAGAASYGPFTESSVGDYEQTIRTTLLGMIITAHAALPHLEQTGGQLVVVGSVAGRLPTPWLSSYAAAKHGVRGFVRSLACELTAQGIPVDLALVAPGPVDTPFWQRARTPDGRLPPELRGVYDADEVAGEVMRALRGAGSLERTVGALFAPAIILDTLIPNLLLRPLGIAARLGWRAREDRPSSGGDGFAKPMASARRSGELSSRRSLLRHTRSVLSPRARP
ncbi:MAG TPA: SDR family NAD(P)-dependent oxidoreductase [Solirubrobacteraceae bacterium]|nr:SDR family NAD(P)-dependent oxidoreductase [Solirubrobacteraceae bacterium]